MKLKACVVLLTIVASLVPRQQLRAQANDGSPLQKKSCTVPSEELEVIASYLGKGNSEVLMAKTDPPRVDVDSLNLLQVSHGHGKSPEVRTDFRDKNKSSCTIRTLEGNSNVHLITQSEHDLIFRNGWGEFHNKYGKQAELLYFSRVGFNSEKTLALLHVSSRMGGMAASGTLYYYERKKGKWVVKTQIPTWAT